MVNEMGQCLEAYRLKIGLYDNSFQGRKVVPKRHSRVTPEARIAMTCYFAVSCTCIELKISSTIM